jgi:predicted aspartyl protease
MGQFQVPVEIKNPRTLQLVSLDLLIDTGALYTNVPAVELDRIGITRDLEQDVLLADGRNIRRWVGYTFIECQGHVGVTFVLFGEPDDVPVLGSIALQTMGLAVDPVRHKLISVARIQAAGL